ncbi:uncharacterized protein L3040_007645 [Drepanopeziza brunnea f. sp. 'multigermtubi']|uniref:Conserved fungal protein n=1 Tax=Marssonina brunnea f. sp. multigermtubi (strain MB_m1) TaxID=1072389 RepID=K1WKL5_MARBU|nr:uncharacterized protein MBM_03957 [Drepanopeziza brunnea f. sp. 'multigermtubi' MB_m1]EKD18185.1 conserved fungal protein [Drepanopeziza brunnea f. sp. 'multigermtubi' MB_m1]KAJ5037471.1 hypothetical protein L3040_007645 [Drepanopeziza brunnea f. sp. 'multigermtubi']
MPSFFAFQQGTESRAPASESSPLLGRFRAVPDAQRQARRSSSHGLLGNFTGRNFGGRYSLVFGNADSDDSDEGSLLGGEDMGALKRWARTQRDLWLEPKQAVVAKVVDKWWTRWTVLAILPAALAVAWCALPFPKYDLPDDDEADYLRLFTNKTPGHGEARVEINFWFFLFVYYGFYNVTALMWITKVFNIYSLNWWPESLGFPFTVSVIAAISIAAPIPVYYFPQLRQFTLHNTAWICWTFFTMAMPLILACGILVNHERHLGLRKSLSDTQRLFTSSWWTGDTDTLSGRDRSRRPPVLHSTFDPDAPLDVALASENTRERDRNLALRRRWLPASFMRFIWFCTALYIAMMAYVLGEAYAEIYLRTLPHDTFQTIVYVYTWVLTVHLLDALTGWILGGDEGERVGSYPLGWIFKLYFLLTYQSYVRALYARLRSPQQFILLQVLSSSFLIILAPLTISKPFHYVLTILSINGQTLRAYQKFCARNIFLRSAAENVSMLAFLGSILVLHYGTNKDVYPYFAFDRKSPGDVDENPIGNGEAYDFGLTFYASIVTWACEIVAAWIVRRILWYGWKVDITGEAKQDLGMWPELLPTGVVVMVHVLQNMLFSIVRLKFH